MFQLLNMYSPDPHVSSVNHGEKEQNTLGSPRVSVLELLTHKTHMECNLQFICRLPVLFFLYQINHHPIPHHHSA